MEFHYELPAGTVTVQVEPTGCGYAIIILRPNQSPESYQVGALRPEHGQLTLCFDDKRVRAHVAKFDNTRYVALDGHSWQLEPPKPVGRKREGGGGSLQATMPGKVLDVLVQEGQEVEAGAPLVLLEAMKMELRITAPNAGVVRSVSVSAGEIVDQGQELVGLLENTPTNPT